MAGIQFKGGKLHGASEAKAIIRHACADERTEHEHSNKDIDISKTGQNSDLHGLSYQQMCDVYDKKMIYYKANAGHKLRPDAVTLMDLVITTPRDLPKDPAVEDAWYRDVEKVINGHYGADVVLDIKIHRDEVHEYTDPSTGRQMMSRTHGHCFVFPEVDLRLNARNFCNRKNIVELNREVDAMTREKYHCRYMTGDKVVDRRWQTVEQLKQASDAAALEKRARDAEQTLQSQPAVKAMAEAAERAKQPVEARPALLRRGKVIVPKATLDALIKNNAAGVAQRDALARGYEAEQEAKAARRAAGDAQRKAEEAQRRLSQNEAWIRETSGCASVEEGKEALEAAVEEQKDVALIKAAKHGDKLHDLARFCEIEQIFKDAKETGVFRGDSEYSMALEYARLGVELGFQANEMDDDIIDTGIKAYNYEQAHQNDQIDVAAPQAVEYQTKKRGQNQGQNQDFER